MDPIPSLAAMTDPIPSLAAMTDPIPRTPMTTQSRGYVRPLPIPSHPIRPKGVPHRDPNPNPNPNPNRGWDSAECCAAIQGC